MQHKEQVNEMYVNILSDSTTLIAAGLPPPRPPPPPPNQLGDDLLTVWALKPPNDTPLHPVKVTRGLLYIHHLCTYDLYVPVRNDFWCVQIHYLGKWEVVGLWKSLFFWVPNGTCL